MPRKKKTEETTPAIAADTPAVAEDVPVATDDVPTAANGAPQDADAGTAATVLDLLPPEEFDVEEAGSEEAGVDRAVTFRLAGQLYGLPIGVVQEIQQIAELLPIPDADPAVVGLIEIRGLVVPALDLRALVGLEESPYTLETPMVFCRVGGHLVCLIVDSVEDVVDLPADGIQPPSALYALADKMLGTVRLANGIAVLLDIDRLIPETAFAVAESGQGGRA